MSACISPVCDRPVESDGMCHSHYMRRRRTGNARLDVPIGLPGQSILDVESKRARPWCECAGHAPESCGPLFGWVQQCSHCRKPYREQLSKEVS